MNEYDYADAIDEADDFQDGALDVQDAQLDQYEQYPSAGKPNETILTWFWKIVRLKNSTKVSNLSDSEIGKAPLTVRGLQRVALVADYLHEDSVKDFFQADAEIILATAMSRRGWLVEQSISQKKQTTRARQRNVQSTTWRPFQKKATTGNPNQ